MRWASGWYGRRQRSRALREAALRCEGVAVYATSCCYAETLPSCVPALPLLASPVAVVRWYFDVFIVATGINGAAANGGFEGGGKVLSGGVVAHEGWKVGCDLEVVKGGHVNSVRWGNYFPKTFGDILTIAN